MHAFIVDWKGWYNRGMQILMSFNTEVRTVHHGSSTGSDGEDR